ncbi:ACP S-malonyltransferase [Alteromonas sp. a30]|uniref:ACP S-malonyltransferase n=1 Tax=Alteromonas sp. a30 TaxID=2730917 RepID=UPI00227F98FF|nr:ACP S-malonyltransferase [Alteromonas sp. a30]MCY7295209.1 ACP S-malonyltransferase [Alteromonas sp. a30]
MKKLAIVFSGQGSQYVGMGKTLFEQHEIVRDMFAKASDTLGLDMEHLCFSESADVLNSTENTQPAILLCSMAAWQVFQQQTGLTPGAMAGHSLGELSALVAAGAMRLEDGLKLARARGLAMAQCGNDGKTGMSAVTKLTREHLEKVCNSVDGFGRTFVVANYNSPRQQVLSGDVEQLKALGEQLKAEGGSVIPLRVSGAFHSPYMAPAAEAFTDVINNIDLTEPHIPVIANVTAKPHGDAASIKASLISQITSPVLWQDTLNYLAQEAGIDTFVEAGPKDVLKKLATTTLPNVTAFALDKQEDEKAMQDALQAAIKSLKERPTVLGKCMAVAVATRNTNFDNDTYQQGVIVPYQQLKEMHEKHSAEGSVASPAEMVSAMKLLQQIMVCKGATEQEQQQRFRQVAEQTGCEKELAQFI